MAAAVAIIFIVPWLDRSNVASIRYKGILSKIAIVMFVVSFITLDTWNCYCHRDWEDYVNNMYFNVLCIFPSYAYLHKH